MPAVASVPKELYLSSSLKDLNKKTEVKPEKISTKSYVHSAQKIFKAAEECRLDRDEERAYVLYMKFVTVYNLIKKRPDFKQQQDYFHSILGPANIKKAIEEAERLSESLKLRYEEAEVRKKLEEKDRQEEEQLQQKRQEPGREDVGSSAKGSLAMNLWFWREAMKTGFFAIHSIQQMLKSLHPHEARMKRCLFHWILLTLHWKNQFLLKLLPRCHLLL